MFIIGLYSQTLLKMPNMKLHENPTGGNRSDTRRRTDRNDEANSCSS